MISHHFESSNYNGSQSLTSDIKELLDCMQQLVEFDHNSTIFFFGHTINLKGFLLGIWINCLLMINDILILLIHLWNFAF